MWTASGWSVSPADSMWGIVTAQCNEPILTDTSGDWVLAFKPGKVARALTYGWNISVTATDASGSGDSTLADKTMEWYGEITANDGSFSFGDLDLVATDQAISTPTNNRIQFNTIVNGN